MRMLAWLACLASIVVLSSPSAAQSMFTVPEETVVRFYDLVYAPLDGMTTHRDVIDQRFCDAYELLTAPTKRRIDKGPFVLNVFFHRTFIHREGMQVGVASYSDDKSAAKVTVNLVLSTWVGGPSLVPGPGGSRPVIIETLLKEDDHWRLLMSDDRVNLWLNNFRRAPKREVKCAGWRP